MFSSHGDCQLIFTEKRSNQINTLCVNQILKLTVYYVEVTDEMKVSKGSGIIDEGHCNYNHLYYRAGVGTSGSLQILYYVEVTDEMKVGKGSEIIDEGHCNYNIQLLTSMR